jgi:hypothetical protein
VIMTTANSSASKEVITAALLVIGSKILSGRTKDQNIGYIAEYLTARGIDLKEVRVVGDEERAIVDALNALQHRCTRASVAISRARFWSRPWRSHATMMALWRSISRSSHSSGIPMPCAPYGRPPARGGGRCAAFDVSQMYGIVTFPSFSRDARAGSTPPRFRTIQV